MYLPYRRTFFASIAFVSLASLAVGTMEIVSRRYPVGWVYLWPLSGIALVILSIITLERIPDDSSNRSHKCRLSDLLAGSLVCAVSLWLFGIQNFEVAHAIAAILIAIVFVLGCSVGEYEGIHSTLPKYAFSFALGIRLAGTVMAMGLVSKMTFDVLAEAKSPDEVFAEYLRCGCSFGGIQIENPILNFFVLGTTLAILAHTICLGVSFHWANLDKSNSANAP